jgi:tRNA U34 5-methylaminomethyl-2-thiouridine-forming methyltransferase MnmC
MTDGRRKLILTDDGSHSIFDGDLDVTFHSTHGAIQESRHVFINAGLKAVHEAFPDMPLSILEMGYGTGLNAFLTAIETYNFSCPVRYLGLEAFPLEMGTAATLNYPDQLGHEELFNTIQIAPWGSPVSVHDYFSISKQAIPLEAYLCMDHFHVIYYDAFAPEAQPQLWTEDVFRKLSQCMNPGGALVTYCSKGDVRRAMQRAGWRVEKLTGPPGKREMVRAWWDGSAKG